MRECPFHRLEVFASRYDGVKSQKLQNIHQNSQLSLGCFFVVSHEELLLNNVFIISQLFEDRIDLLFGRWSMLQNEVELELDKFIGYLSPDLSHGLVAYILQSFHLAVYLQDQLL